MYMKAFRALVADLADASEAAEARNEKEIPVLFTLLDFCVSSLRRSHANLLCTVEMLTDDPRRK